MDKHVLSDAALEVIERFRSSAELQAALVGRPNLLTNFVRIAEVSSRLSSDRARFFGTVTRAADASDRAIKIIRGGNDFELHATLLLAAQMFQDLGDVIEEFFPAAVPISLDASEFPN